MIKLYKIAGVRDRQTWIFTPNQNGLYQRGERERERERERESIPCTHETWG